MSANNTIMEKIAQIANNIPIIFENGKSEGEKRWSKYFYNEDVSFSNSNSISVALPFLPDYISITAYDSIALSQANTFVKIENKRASFGKYGGMMGLVASGLTLSFAAVTNASVGSLFTYTEGEDSCAVTFAPPSSGIYTTSLFRNDVKYRVIAYKSGLSDRELLINEVNSLSDGGGSVNFSQKRVLDTVSESEWEEIIAAKRSAGWTFVLI